MYSVTLRILHYIVVIVPLSLGNMKPITNEREIEYTSQIYQTFISAINQNLKMQIKEHTSI